MDSQSTNKRGETSTKGGLSPLVLILIVVGVLSLGLLGTITGVWALFKPAFGQPKSDVVISQVKVIEAAVVRFQLKHEEEYPNNLEELTQPDPANDGQPYLQPEALVDPWKNKYQMDPSGPHHDGARPDVFTRSPDGKTIGNW